MSNSAKRAPHLPPWLQVDEVRQELALARAALSSRQGAPAPAMASAGSMGVNATRVRELEQEKNNLQDEVCRGDFRMRTLKTCV